MFLTLRRVFVTFGSIGQIVPERQRQYQDQTSDDRGVSLKETDDPNARINGTRTIGSIGQEKKRLW